MFSHWVWKPGFTVHSQGVTHEWAGIVLAIGYVIKSTLLGMRSCSQIVNFFQLYISLWDGYFSHFSHKILIEITIKHENPMSIYDSVYYFQIMLVIVICSKFKKTIATIYLNIF